MNQDLPNSIEQKLLHSVHISWNDSVDHEHGDRVATALNNYSTTVPGLLFYRAGPDLGLRANTPDLSIVALFDNQGAYQSYAVDEGHQAIIAELIEPFARARNSSQIAIDAPSCRADYQAK